MQGSALLFFAIFAIILVGMYLAVRREWLPISIVAGGGVFGSIVSMMMMSFAQGNSVVQAILVSVILGSVFSIGTLAIAVYFHNNEMRDQQPSVEGEAG